MGGGGGGDVVGFSSSVAAPVRGKFKINNLPAETEKTWDLYLLDAFPVY